MGILYRLHFFMEPNEHEENTVLNSDTLDRKCRTCQHPLLYHYVGQNKSTKKPIVGSCNKVQKGFCECTEFMPKDNLDYIELLAKRKGLIPDEDKKDNV